MSRSLFATLTEGALDRPGLRRTALFLHGLHPTDRDLLMQGVSADQRRHLAALLQELNDLGIQAADAAEGIAVATWPVADTAVTAQESTQAALPPPSEGEEEAWDGPAFSHELDADWLGRADARCVSEVLAAEPDVLVVRVLGLNAWPWKGRVLNLFDPERRARVEAMLLDPDDRYREHARLDAALVRQLRRVVEHRAGVSLARTDEAPVRPRRWSARTWGGWLRRRAAGRPA